MEMDKEDEIALEESISDWRDRARGLEVTRLCPLCALGKQRRDGGDGMCCQCIIKKHTGETQCNGTPYWPRGTTPEFYQREIEFLESLRPEKKVGKDIIEVGDEVEITNYSWAFRLNKGVITRFGSLNHIWAVVGIRMILPEGDNRRGKFGNDTILYDPQNGEYISTREEYLKLVEPKHCPECGKAK